MRHKTASIGFLLFYIIACFAGCTQTDVERETVIGSWITEVKQNLMSGDNYTETRIFHANGSYITTHLGFGRIPGAWRLSDGKVIIHTYFPGSYQYHFSFNNSRLTLIADANRQTEHLTRQ